MLRSSLITRQLYYTHFITSINTYSSLFQQLYNEDDISSVQYSILFQLSLWICSKLYNFLNCHFFLFKIFFLVIIERERHPLIKMNCFFYSLSVHYFFRINEVRNLDNTPFFWRNGINCVPCILYFTIPYSFTQVLYFKYCWNFCFYELLEIKACSFNNYWCINREVIFLSLLNLSLIMFNWFMIFRSVMRK